MTIFNEIRDNLTDEQIAEATATGIMLVQTSLIDLQKGYGSAPVFPIPSRLNCANEMWALARYWKDRADEEFRKDNSFGAFTFLRARLYTRLAIMVMRETGEWWDFPHTQ